jgi:hypothetical protein
MFSLIEFKLFSSLTQILIFQIYLFGGEVLEKMREWSSLYFYVFFSTNN